MVFVYKVHGYVREVVKVNEANLACFSSKKDSMNLCDVIF
jgi:hypothetical protein